MPRPCCCRRVACRPACRYFKPQGVPLANLEEVALGFDELEAIRLADLEGMYQEDAAQKMNVSRPTFTRIVQAARRKVAEALVRGKALKLKGGNVMFAAMRRFCCSDCRHTWEVPYGTARPHECPQCHSHNLHRAPEDRGFARRGTPGGYGRGCCYRGGAAGFSNGNSEKKQKPESRQEGATE
jgi:predicted DNA-binding protein (UPF0251 family)